MELSPSRRVHRQAAAPGLSVPWHLRKSAKHDASKTCWCLGSKYLLGRVEFALRVTLLGCLPMASLVFSEGDNIFVSASLSTTIAVALCGRTIGEGLQVFSIAIQSFPLWLPMMTIASAAYVYNYTAAWWCVYIGLTFIFGVIADGLTQKLCILFTGLSMLGMLGEARDTDFPARLAADTLFGLLFALAVPFFPPWRTSTQLALAALEQLMDDLSMCFTGLSDCFWSETNVNRSVDLARVKFIRNSMNDLIMDCKNALKFAEYEWFGNSLAVKDMKARLEVCKELMLALDSLFRACEIVEATPSIIDGSENAQQFGTRLRGHLESVAIASDAVINFLARPEKHYGKDDVHDPLSTLGDPQSQLLDALIHASDSLEVYLWEARRDIIYGSDTVFHVEEYQMPMGFFMFHHRYFAKRLITFMRDRRDMMESPPACCSNFGRILLFLFDPVRNGTKRLRRILFNRGDEEIHILKSALKTSVSLALSVLFFIAFEPEKTAISGPSIIAFISSTDTGQMFHQATLRLMGTMFGAVFGFFASTVAHNSVQYVAGLCVVILILSFFRTGQRFGLAAFYGSFVAVSMVVPGTTSDSAMRRIQQNTFAAVIYVAVATMISPQPPSGMLSQQRRGTIRALAESNRFLLGIFAHLSSEDDITICNASMTAMAIDAQDDQQRAAIILEKRREWVEAGKATVARVIASLERERWMLPLAEEEPSLRRKPFPGKINWDILDIESKMAAIQRTMWNAWHTLLLEAVDTQPRVKEMVDAMLAPIEEFSSTMTDALNVLSMILADPHTQLTTEMARLSLLAKTQAIAIRDSQRSTIARMNHQYHSPTNRTPAAADDYGTVHAEPGHVATIVANTEPISHATPPPENGNGPLARTTSGVVSETNSATARKARDIYGLSNETLFSSSDISAFHCINFCAISMAFELRRMFVAAEAWQQHESRATGY